jgi:hypothetical protein
MKLRRSLIVLGVLALSGAACQLLVGIDDHDFKTPSPDGALGEAAADALPTTCTFGIVPPGQPDGGAEPDQPDYVFAMSHATLRGRDADGGAVGFDIDGVCTCDERDHSVGGGRPSCTPPASPLRPGSCDEDGGIDNAVASVFDVFANVPGFNDTTGSIDLEITCGRQTLLYTLTGYNGLANDNQVVVAAIESVGIHEPHAGGIEADFGPCKVDEAQIDGGAAYPAKFDGTDVWSPIANAGPSLINGWVRDFRLVLDGRNSKGNASILPIIFGSRVVTIGTPIMVATLVPLDADRQPLAVDSAGRILSPDGKASSFRIDHAVVSGRASAADLLSASGTIRLAGATPGQSELCAQPGPYCLLKGVVCSAVDTMKLPNLDFSGESCDALSMVLQFDAVAAKKASVARPPAPPADGGCAEKFSDTCDGGTVVCP